MGAARDRSVANGALYSWGNGKDERLGFLDCENRTVPARIGMSVFPGDACVVYELADSLALCLSARRADVLSPRQLPAAGAEPSLGPPQRGMLQMKVHGGPSRVCVIACGNSHSAAITEEGKLFMFGKNADGQCGHGTASDDPVHGGR